MDILRHDSDNLINVLKSSASQIEEAWKRDISLSIDKGNIKNIVFTGMGGSAISGDLLANFISGELDIPFQVNRSYGLPSYTGENTLVIVSSYSGNTEETISCFQEALEKGCKIVSITTGGYIGNISREKSIDTVELTEGYQPRFALYESFFTLLKIFQTAGFIGSQDIAVERIKDRLVKLSSEFSTENCRPFEIAEMIKDGKTVIYSSSGDNDSVGKRLKGQLNENGKVHAWANEYPEFNHNEIVGWQTVSSEDNYTAVHIFDDSFHERIKKRISITKDLISSFGVDIIVIEGESESFKVRLLETVYICDWISFYVGLMIGKDPGEIKNIDELKKRMSED